MPKDSNLSPSDTSGPGEPSPVEVNLGRALRQHLEGLLEQGVTTLPTAQGMTFDFGEASAATSTGVREASPASRGADYVTRRADPRPSPSPAAPDAVAPTPARQPVGTESVEDPYPAPSSDRPGSLAVIQQEVQSCTQCQELSSLRNSTVFGVGNPDARLVLVGEGPGEQEDRTGIPFVGAAGQLLDKILAACGLSREDVYILNAVKCRPPRNRNPKPEELDQCWGYARRQLEILQPEFICCLGSVAARTLLQTNQSVGRMRKRFHTYRGSRVLVTYHPSYLLRTASAKKHAWEDMQMLMREMGIKIPGKES